MKSKNLFIIIFLSFALQCWILYPILMENYPDFPTGLNYLLGVPPVIYYQMLMFWYITFASISFYYSGSFKEALSGFGQYLLVRSSNRVQWILLQYFIVGVKLLVILILQTGVSYLLVFFFQLNIDLIINTLLLKAILIYYLTFLFLLISQLFLELYFNPQIGFLIINTYVVGSILGASLLFKYKIHGVLIYLLVPNYAMISRLDLLSKNSLVINFVPALTIIISLILIVLIFSITSIKRIDFLH
ncbi:DUF2705 family protein [Cytobacillus firmus]|uniref:DUF2705 family protein n=1 Tax=Cytobacillus firmus TaxID=1399 RepID=UPI003699122F